MYTKNSATIFCRCSECGESIIKRDVNIFSLSGGELRVKCEICEKSSLIMELTRANSVRLDVPCVFCRGSHKYTLSAPSFFEKDVFALSCAMTGYDACIIGADDKKVSDAIDRADEELDTLIGQSGYAGEPQSEDDMRRVSENLEDIISLANKYLVEGRIYCKCEDAPKISDLAMTVSGSCAEIRCKKCGAAIIIDAFEDEDVDDFESDGGIFLE